MSEFLKSNPQLDEAISGANNFQAMREKMLATLAAQGQVVRSRTDAYDVRVIPPASESAVPANGFKYEKEVRFAESTGKRTLLIRANTLEDLNALERQITG